jgi:hypothetical protein
MWCPEVSKPAILIWMFIFVPLLISISLYEYTKLSTYFVFLVPCLTSTLTYSVVWGRCSLENERHNLLVYLPTDAGLHDFALISKPLGIGQVSVHFSFLTLDSRSDSLDGGSARRKAAAYTRTQTHPCLERNSNPRFHCSNERRQFARPRWTALDLIVLIIFGEVNGLWNV